MQKNSFLLSFYHIFLMNITTIFIKFITIKSIKKTKKGMKLIDAVKGSAI